MHTARTNVWFEIGMFAARYGQENAIVVVEGDDLGKANIPSDYYGVNFPTFSISKPAKLAIRTAWQRKATLSTKISTELRAGLEAFFDSKLKSILSQRLGTPAEFVTTIADRNGCYEKAKEMIEGAKRRVFTVVSYEQELEDQRYPGGLLPFLKSKIEQLKRDNNNKFPPGFRIKRWMNLGAEEIRKQATQILCANYGKHIEIKDTYCHFIEAVVTEDKVLLPLPKPEGKHIWVGQGIYIESVQIASFFADWFENSVPEPNGICLTKSGLSDYLQSVQIRNAGNRASRCYACASRLPDQERLNLHNQHPHIKMR